MTLALIYRSIDGPLQEGVQPMWEDDMNKTGGRWLINLEKKQRMTDLDNFWLETVSEPSESVLLLHYPAFLCARFEKWLFRIPKMSFIDVLSSGFKNDQKSTVAGNAKIEFSHVTAQAQFFPRFFEFSRRR